MASYDLSHHIALEELLKTKQQNIKSFEHKARELANSAMEHHKLYVVFRIARELQDLDCDVEDIEDFLVATRDPFYLYRFAREIRSANIVKLQQAMINTRDIDYIARFACFVNGANTELLEEVIVQSKNARGAYVWMQYGKHPNIQKLKPIFLKSKRPRYLYALAHHIIDPQELERIEDMVMAGKSFLYIRLWVQNIPGASLAKAEEQLLKSRNMDEIKKFVRYVDSDKLNKLVMLS